MSNSKALVGTISRTFKRVHENPESCDHCRRHDRSFARKHARVMQPRSLLLRRASFSICGRAKRENGVIRWWSDNDRARANDWHPRRVRQGQRRIGSLTCGVDAGHCGSLLPVGGGSGPPPISPICSD
jgi:hypothetical protein